MRPVRAGVASSTSAMVGVSPSTCAASASSQLVSATCATRPVLLPHFSDATLSTLPRVDRLIERDDGELAALEHGRIALEKPAAARDHLDDARLHLRARAHLRQPRLFHRAREVEVVAAVHALAHERHALIAADLLR